MTSLGRWLTGGFLLLASLGFPSALGAESVCAAEGANAALVVDTGGSVQTFCVSLPEGETSGLGLIALAGEQHGLAYKLGFGGEAVCMLAGVGPSGDDCFEEYPNFWGFWRGDGQGDWSWSGTGAGSVTVGDGDIHGWSWGSGSNGDTHPRPPVIGYGDVCTQQTTAPPAERPKQRQEDGPAAGSGGNDDRPARRPSPGPPAALTGRRPVSEPRSRRPGQEVKKGGQERNKGSRGGSDDESTVGRQVSPSPSRSVPIFDVGVPNEPAAGGPPPFGLAALGAAASLGAAGFLFSRRRRSV